MDKTFYEEKIKNLKSLIEVSSIISSTFDLPTLTSLIMEIAKKVMKAEAATLMLLDEKNEYLTWDIALGEMGSQIKKERKLKVGEGIAGWVAQKGEPIIIKDAQTDPRWFKGIDKKTNFITKSIICVPLKVKEKIIGILEAFNKIGALTFSDDDQELFIAYASQAAVAIENTRMQKQIIEKEKMEQELTLARRIQRSFLPSSYPKIPGFKLFADTLAARQVGGDFYDFITISKDKLSFFIGDVSGKGIPAALYMARTMHDFRYSCMRNEDPAKVLAEVNSLILKNPVSGLFVTSFYGLLDFSQKKIYFSNAGHNPPFLCCGTKCEEISNAGSPPLGINAEIKFETGEINLSKDDLLILYTDGITESMSPSHEQFGTERFARLIPSLRHFSPEEITKEIINAMNKFTANAPLRDDTTLFALKAL